MSLEHNPRSPYYAFDELDELDYEGLKEYRNMLASVLDEQPRNHKTASSYDILRETEERVKYFERQGV